MRSRRLPGAFLGAALVSVLLCPGPAGAEGILEAVSGDVETVYSLVSTKIRDDSGTTTQTDTHSVRTRFSGRLNYDPVPTININGAVSYERDWFRLTGDAGESETTVTRLRPSLWITFRDPVLSAIAGYDFRDETVDTQGAPATTLTRQTYSAGLNWRPLDLPSTELRYTRTATEDDPRSRIDRTDDYILLKSRYSSGGFSGSYTGSYLRSDDAIRDAVSRQILHEGTLLYGTTFLDGRLSVATDNRVAFSDVENSSDLPLPPVGGFSALDDTPLDGPPLVANPALVDGNLTASAGVNIGFQPGDITRRNVGLDFLTPVQLNLLRVWVDGWGSASLPADIGGFFVWEVYTSADNLTWSFHATATSVFGPFDRRFEVSFPAVTTRYIKVVTRPLPPGVVGSTSTALFPTIFVTEIQALVERGDQTFRTSRSQLTQNHSLDVRVVLLRVPSLYYRLNAQYRRVETFFGPVSEVQTRYVISNGLSLSHRFNPVLATTANASVEIGSEREELRTAFLYYASLAATPLSTLTSSLVVSGTHERTGDNRRTSNSIILYNTAQLYRGIESTLNLGVSFLADENEIGVETRQRDLFVNLGTAVTPHPSLAMTSYYQGRLTQSSGQASGAPSDTTEHRISTTVSFTPFRTLALSAAVDVTSRTGEGLTVRQNYGLSWAPFPDGRLQFSLSYSENYLPGLSRSVRPTLRWYLTGARRSYLEASYQFTMAEAGRLDTETHLISAGMRLFF